MVISYQVVDCFLEVPERRGTIPTCKGHLNLIRDVLCNKEPLKYVFLLHHIDASCRTVVLVVFFKFPYNELQSRRTPKNSYF